jgi:23S rRNA pseudouridine1911/1915/1917 synthase
MSEQRIEIVVSQAGDRLDRFLGERVPGLSRSAAQRLVEQGMVTVNQAVSKASYKLRVGDAVAIRLVREETAQPAPEPIRLDIVYEDQALLVVDKPAGMVVHPAPGHTGGTLVNALLAHCPELAGGEEGRPGIVHRLDRETSGLIVVAKDEGARRALQRQFQERQVLKTYLALVHGHLQPAWGRIEAPLGRDPAHRQRIAVLEGGRPAVTEYRVMEHLEQPGLSAGLLTLLQALPLTGRTHQIRVHLASIGHPVVGDTIYGRRRGSLSLARHFLHAWRLGFDHPITGQRLAFEAPLPPDLEAVLVLLRSR